MLLPGFAQHPKLVAATALGMGLNFWRGKQWVLKAFWACAAVAFSLARLAPDFASNQGEQQHPVCAWEQFPLVQRVEKQGERERKKHGAGDKASAGGHVGFWQANHLCVCFCRFLSFSLSFLSNSASLTLLSHVCARRALSYFFSVLPAYLRVGGSVAGWSGALQAAAAAKGGEAAAGLNASGLGGTWVEAVVTGPWPASLATALSLTSADA